MAIVPCTVDFYTCSTQKDQVMTFNRNTDVHNDRLISEAFFNLIRGFVDWFVLSPMIYSWGLLIFTLFVITFVNFQDGTVELLSVIGNTYSELVEKYPYLERLAIIEPSANENGGVDLGGDEFKSYIFKIYVILTIPLAMLGALIDFIRGSTVPRPMSGKLKFLGTVTLVAIMVLYANYIFGSETYHGSAILWGVMFIVGPGIVFLISSCSLFLSHIIRSIDYKRS